ncbi:MULTISPECIES: RidA family protein [unclassified Pseudomonas]|uniref:RidA family protein n=1 Tax=unclassified Pseudomonas TaxID=196821 RepID=UPI000BC6B9A4|nr:MULTISPECIES: RidA family protein [unclassified Pseudomonas]PVZ19707.1 enamine deaminase RidA (YjgF/YER057c/UK114 family) [Pseudomonas sp. URIL14HWK12:I12]PVZ22708.1 enamine deaminase RidA (YjgF/YER057c/UK114 family) [Pseudomonas sp. URIL14HWK12:I10]PVZ37662.1 enamine deaminase RidA (YjgF/YER057c/UK114 family) [Pseudomonas sp. URIL14HWK12:I11]SNZ15431.1 Enamine deaminase RidA, house cleaning of reactive enamine intermediates, YjgF/YER057c/UK114 family [Pseudomonas sp. URIL14HWK12:I9]
MPNRHAIYLQQFAHANPIPAACRRGPLLMSGVINGNDPATGELPADLDTQCRHVFTHVQAILQAAGATPDDVVKMTVWLQDREQRGPLNEQWLKLFPDAKSRPARHALQAATPSKFLIQCEFTAWVMENAKREKA